MSFLLRTLVRFSLILLLATLIFGLLGSWAFLYPELYNHFLPFYQLRPAHVSAAIFWIISGAVAGIYYYKDEVFNVRKYNKEAQHVFVIVWIVTILLVFVSYALDRFGGREYWAFPPLLCVPLLFSWVFFMASYFQSWSRSNSPKPLYVWMWTTGIFFFLLTFIEQNLWQIPWFRTSFLKEITVEWKANGSMVGAWNQMIYGTSLYLMVKLSNDQSIANNKKAFAFYFLGITNLMFNWGHHIYNVPIAPWIRDTSYLISMTEWLIFISIIQGFRKKLDERKRLRHKIAYKFLIASEFWVFANLLLALLMSIPAINRYTHGTHITVAHSMGTTIGINTMILLGSFSYMLKADQLSITTKKIIHYGYWLSQIALSIFWLALIIAGILKGYRSIALGMTNFQEIMRPVLPFIKVFSFAGIGILVGLGCIAIIYIKRVGSMVSVSSSQSTQFD